jgi:hypothetical protein
MMKANGIARRSTTLAGAALLLLGVTAAAAQDAGSQNGALNTIPRNEGFGAANAGGTGHVPPDAAANEGLPKGAWDQPLQPLPGSINTIPEGEGYGAANARGTGKVPPGPQGAQAASLPVTEVGKPGQNAVAGPGGVATGSEAGSSAGSVETGGTEGAGTH